MLYGYLSVGESRRRGRTVRTAGESRLAARKVLKLELRCGRGGKASDWWRNAGDPPPRGTCPFRGNQTTGGSLPRPRKCEDTVLVTTGTGPGLRQTACRRPIQVGHGI